MYREYKMYCEDSNCKALGRNIFINNLEVRGLTKQVVRDATGKQYNGFRGVKLFGRFHEHILSIPVNPVIGPGSEVRFKTFSALQR